MTASVRETWFRLRSIVFRKPSPGCREELSETDEERSYGEESNVANVLGLELLAIDVLYGDWLREDTESG